MSVSWVYVGTSNADFSAFVGQPRLQHQGLMQNHTFSLLCFIPGWKYSSGFVTADMIKEHLPPPGEATLILVCGPPRMVQETAHPSLEQLGYTKDMIFTY